MEFESFRDHEKKPLWKLGLFCFYKDIQPHHRGLNFKPVTCKWMHYQFIGSLFFSNTSIDQKQHLIFPIRDCSHILNVKHEKATSCHFASYSHCDDFYLRKCPYSSTGPNGFRIYTDCNHALQETVATSLETKYNIHQLYHSTKKKPHSKIIWPINNDQYP